MMNQSVNTFLNAMTYSDKTVYPASSMNKKDYFNLFDVYADAVFFPLLKKEAFIQEGHRLEIDEKQDNFNHLTADLQKAGEYALAERLVQENESIRCELKSFYKELPRCVFQGDENFSNLCVDENRRISGLFDFNMSGTEVIANYLANAALNFFYTDEIMQSRSADEIYRMLTKAYAENTELIRKYYNFTPQEFRAYRLYSKIAMYSAYWNTSAFSEYLAQEQCAEKVVRLLWKIAEEDFRA